VKAIEVTEEIEQAIDRARKARTGVTTAQRGSAVWGQATRWQSETKCALADLVLAAPVRPVVQGTPVDVAGTLAHAARVERAALALYEAEVNEVCESRHWNDLTGALQDSQRAQGKPWPPADAGEANAVKQDQAAHDAWAQRIERAAAKVSK
jgi:hypothetical protein